MFDYMDFMFYTRRILISNVFLILALLHAGVDCELNMEVTGSQHIGSTANFTCTTSQKNYFAIFSKGSQKIAIISGFGVAIKNNISLMRDRVNVSSGQILSPESTQIFYYTLILKKLQCSDEGNYTYNIDNSVQTVKPLQIKSKPQMPYLTAPTDFVVVGDIVTFECTANVGQPARNLSMCVSQGADFNCSEVVTLKDLGNCSYSQTTTMVVNITEDTNRANCEVVNNPNLKVEQNWKVQFPVSSIKFVPDITVVKLMEGESKTIFCEARGAPTPTYSWEFEPQNDRLNPTTFKIQNLNLNSVHLKESGIYTCIAINTIRNVTNNMTKSITVVVVPTTPAPTTTIPTIPTVQTSTGPNGNGTKTGPQTNEKDDGWKLIVGIVGAILFLIILIILLVILYRQRAKPAEIEEPPEKPRNNHEVNMKETKPDLVYSTGLEKGKLPMYNTGFDHNGEDDLYYAELAFDDKPRSRKPVVPLYDNHLSNDPYKTVMPQV